MSPKKAAALPVISGRTFTEQIVVVDGFSYERCRFVDCMIQYSGGAAEILDCELSANTIWDFRGSAASTIRILEAVGFKLDRAVSRAKANVRDKKR